MMWQTPKTDWVSSDVFCVQPDYERITQNLAVLYGQAQLLFPGLAADSFVAADAASVPHADFFNTVEQNTARLCEAVQFPCTIRTLHANAPVWDAADLCRIETNTRAVRGILTGANAMLPKLAFALKGVRFG